MVKGRNKYLNLVFLSTFLFVTLFINFFHTETTIEENDNCPACHFQNFSLATNHIHFFSLIPPSILGIFRFFYTFNYHYIYIIEPASRSPPYV